MGYHHGLREISCFFMIIVFSRVFHVFAWGAVPALQPAGADVRTHYAYHPLDSLEIWEPGNLGIWTSGNLEIWEFGNQETCKSRNLGSKKINKIKILDI